MNAMELEHLRADIQRDIIEEQERHRARMEELTQKREQCAFDIAALANGFDPKRIARALEIMSVKGSYLTAGQDRDKVIRQAVDFFAEIDGAVNLNREYVGTKQYDRWDGQAVRCEYGMSPSHGHVIFSIGLNHDYRGQALYDEDCNVCIEFLNSIHSIHYIQERATK